MVRSCGHVGNGRVEALACCPELPDIGEQERRDRVPSGTYRRLVTSGVLGIAEGLRVQPPSLLWKMVTETWGAPVLVIYGRFRLPDLQDAVDGSAPIEARVTRWSESAADIRALRRQVNDGPLSVSPDAHQLLTVSLSAARVQNDDAGNTRLIKRGTNHEARNDVAAGLVLLAGAAARYPAVQSPSTPSRGPIVVG